MPDWPGKPPQELFLRIGEPNLVFVTIRTEDSRPWLAAPEVHRLLVDVWQAADAWLIGRYILMPDHVHFFCAPHDWAVPLKHWITHWKSRLTKAHGNPAWRFQSLSWHHRLRKMESYAQKWHYLRNNAVADGLVSSPDEWPYQGQLHTLPWHDE